MRQRTERFTTIARRELQNGLSQTFLSLLPPGFRALRAMGMSSFPDPDAAVEYARAIRASVVARLPELLEEFERRALALGAKVIWTRTALQANEIILDLARERGATYITKSKSMLSEETGLGEHLRKGGVEPFETDLGEFITQLLGRPPFHIVGPAINVPPEEIRDAFLAGAGLKESTTDPVRLGLAARLFLRDKFKHLKMGVVGVNMAVASTGTIINVENEGNIRMIKSSPPTVVALMSPEKVVPSLSDAMHLLRILSRNCTGQKITSYVSLDSGPKRDSEIDGPAELFIVIVDNGRSEIYQDPLWREALRCIRCGACLNTCPVYTKIGGYPYGFAYSGPMGQVLNPLLLGLADTRDLYQACTLCGACREVCPAGIDHPALLLSYRARAASDWHGPQAARVLLRRSLATLLAFAMTHPRLWNLGIKLTRPLFNLAARDGYIHTLPGAQGWFACRDLPAVPEKTFRERWRQDHGQ
ncbi:MAG: lactate utilization protein B [Syntrophaceae bacterium]